MINPRHHIIGVVKRIFPPHMVESQLNTLIPVGTAIVMVATPKMLLATGPRPTVNMWCTHTMKPRNPISTVANTIE